MNEMKSVRMTRARRNSGSIRTKESNARELFIRDRRRVSAKLLQFGRGKDEPV